jgi:hypothetical protein
MLRGWELLSSAIDRVTQLVHIFRSNLQAWRVMSCVNRCSRSVSLSKPLVFSL